MNDIKFTFECLCYHSWFSGAIYFPSLVTALEATQYIPRKKDVLAIEHGTELQIDGERITIAQDFVKVTSVTIDLIKKRIEVIVDRNTEIEYV